MNAAGLAADLTSWSTAFSLLWIRLFWQSAAIAGMGWLALRCTPRLSARLQYRWLFGCYVFCLALPCAASLLPLHLSRQVATAPQPLVTLDPQWALLWTAICAVAGGFGLVRLIAGLWSMHSMLRTAREVSLEERSQYASALAGAGRGPVRLLLSDVVTAPVAVGLSRPAVVLPATLADELSASQLEQVLQHEVEHLARWDDWAALAFAVVRSIAPLLPGLWWLEHQLAVAREMACDDAVLRTTRPRAYAENLARLAATRLLARVPGLAPQLLGGRPQLAVRIDHILDSSRGGVARISRRQLLPVGAAALLLACALLESPAFVGFAPAPVRTARSASPAMSLQKVQAVPASLPLATGRARVTPRPALAHPARRHRRAATPLLVASSAAVTTPASPVAIERTSASLGYQPLQFVLVFWSSPRQELWFTTATFLLPTRPEAASTRADGLHQI